MSCGPTTGWCRNCGRCRLAMYSPKHRANWAALGPVPDPLPRPKPAPRAAASPARAPLPVLPPCQHEGAVREWCHSCRGAEARHVRDCAHPDNPTGTCTRERVGPGAWACAGCPHHTGRAVWPDLPPEPWENLVTVPDPPPFAGGGTRAVVTVAAGDKGKRLLAVSGPLMEAYARRLGADFHVLDWNPVPGWGMAAKFAIGPVVAAYDQTVYLDADVLVRGGCLDLFAQVPAGAAGGVDDWPAVQHTAPDFPAEFRRFAAHVGLRLPPVVPSYLNTGVLVLPRAAAPLLAPPDRPIPSLWCSEQHLWGLRLLAGPVPVHVLPARCNYQWWAHEPAYWPGAAKPGGFAPPPDAVLHFAGVRDTGKKLALMRRWAAGSPGPPPAG